MRIAPLALVARLALAQKTDTPLPANLLRRPRPGGVVVTTTRTKKSLTDKAIPALVANVKQLKSRSALRLGDVLREQTNLSIVAGHG